MTTTTKPRRTRLRQLDNEGRSVALHFRFLNKATAQQAKDLAAWLRQKADDVEDAAYRGRVADRFEAGYMHALGPAGIGAK